MSDVASGQAHAAETTDSANSEQIENSADDSAQQNASDVFKKGRLALVVIIASSLLWYLLADRFTPYTDQARVQAYVVGVAPKVAGLVTQVWVSNNEAVGEGQRLFEIDPAQYQIALERAQSELENARRQVGAGDASVDAARAGLRAAQANELKARQDANRLERLRRDDPGTISMRRLEIARASLDQALAQVAAAEADIQRAIEQKGGEQEETNAILNTARSAVEKAQLDLTNTVVVASSRGFVTDLRAEVGQFAGTGNPVLSMISLNDVWINAEFTENNLGHLRVGTAVDIVFDALPGEVFKGSIRSIGRGISAGQAPPPGTLPSVKNDRDWLRQAQRFPVIVGFDMSQHPALLQQLRVGGQAGVIAYSEGHGILAFLGRVYIRLISLLTYAY